MSQLIYLIHNEGEEGVRRWEQGLQIWLLCALKRPFSFWGVSLFVMSWRSVARHGQVCRAAASAWQLVWSMHSALKGCGQCHKRCQMVLIKGKK